MLCTWHAIGIFKIAILKLQPHGPLETIVTTQLICQVCSWQYMRICIYSKIEFNAFFPENWRRKNRCASTPYHTICLLQTKWEIKAFCNHEKLCLCRNGILSYFLKYSTRLKKNRWSSTSHHMLFTQSHTKLESCAFCRSWDIILTKKSHPANQLA